MFGWRARLGLLVPCINTVLEPEFRHILPIGIDFFTTRMLMKGSSKLEKLSSMESSLDLCLESLIDITDIFLYACTSGSFIKGLTWDNELQHRIYMKTKKKAVTAMQSLVYALHVFSAKNIVVATPYIPEVNEKQRSFFQECGFNVLKIEGMNIIEHGGSGYIESESIYDFAKQVLTGTSPDVLVLSCTNFRTLNIIEKLETDLNIPVISSNQALLWNALRSLNITEMILGHGSLLKGIK
ncbi:MULTISPECIES: maleate cis-trans isomerase family protein [Aminobacterium]|jgi:maleate isomerase|uniref:Asp/Glu/hydantoin racemase n=1 Tax=Aminobacterium colombiense (strain DSM 12261 / ALA-1) TaxID=572547 RepID=D5EDK8_AMICL|nr:aspartate/glutamate racemase family protein [Aminobacterium sp. EBM-42]ADE56640.1 Asp/Glu/hydantoin racemase [Aminobacterium colombiense DSM 12261]NLK30056.1 maleate cis-trans isomerase [Aminobacterium colombiense]